MRDYMKHYMDGNHTEVWAELRALGSKIHAHDYREVVAPIMQELMRRINLNLTMIIKRLQEVEYDFQLKNRIWNLPDDRISRTLDRFEQTYGLLPLSIRYWHTIIGEVNLMGNHPRLSYYAPSISEEIDSMNGSQMSIHSEPFVISFNDSPQKLKPIDIIHDRKIKSGQFNEDRVDFYYKFQFSPDIYHKSGESGGEGLLVIIPDNTIDGIIYDANEEWSGFYFIDYLRTSFQYGGFPGFRFYDPHDPLFPGEEIAFLTKDLLPI
jgi:hypothetical protein